MIEDFADDPYAWGSKDIADLQEKRLASGGWYGYAHPSGWDALVLELDAKIAAIDPDYKIHQSKQKFGQLRYYVEFSNDLDRESIEKINELIREAEDKSITICEVCGDKGSLTSHGYSYTLCPTHSQQRKDRYNA